ncbi:MAG TPA: amidohydrolase, partial [Alcanivorax sp.]|nr:amidohydrolase [Alcanivorax sp.]
LALPAATTPALADTAQRVNQLPEAQADRLVSTFKHLHANPELGFQETETAKQVSKRLKKLGYQVHTGIGGTGVAAVLKNGDGPVVMFRSDMDGLPVKEDTGL